MMSNSDYVLVSVDCETGENMTDSGVDSELSPSSPDSITETSSLNITSPTTTTPSMVIQTPTSNCETVARSAEELVAKMEEEDEEEDDECEDKIADKMETVEALLSLSDASRSPVGSPEKPLITILPAHNPDKGEARLEMKIFRF